MPTANRHHIGFHRQLKWGEEMSMGASEPGLGVSIIYKLCISKSVIRQVQGAMVQEWP